MAEVLLGNVTHYFSKIGVAVVELKEPLHTGDQIHIVGPTTDLEETVESMEVDHHKIEDAEPGDDIGLKVVAKVREGDSVYREINGVAA